MQNVTPHDFPVEQGHNLTPKVYEKHFVWKSFS